MEVNKKCKDTEWKLAVPGVNQRKILEWASAGLTEAWDKYDKAYSEIRTFKDQVAADTERDALDDKVSDLLARVDTFLEDGR